MLVVAGRPFFQDRYGYRTKSDRNVHSYIALWLIPPMRRTIACAYIRRPISRLQIGEIYSTRILRDSRHVELPARPLLQAHAVIHELVRIGSNCVKRTPESIGPSEDSTVHIARIPVDEKKYEILFQLRWENLQSTKEMADRGGEMKSGGCVEHEQQM